MPLHYLSNIYEKDTKGARQALSFLESLINKEVEAHHFSKESNQHSIHNKASDSKIAGKWLPHHNQQI